MKHLNVFSALAVAALSLSAVSCSQSDLYAGPETTKGEANDFDFATQASTPVSVNYSDLGYGSLTTRVYFEIYSENPMSETEHGLVKKANLKPIFAGYTAEDGTWSGNIDVPSYAETLYSYAPASIAPTILTADVKNGLLFAPNKNNTTTATVRTGLYSNAVKNNGWKTWLGAYSSTGMDASKTDYNKYSGGISYANQILPEDEATLRVSKQTALELYGLHQSVIEVSRPCPSKYRTSRDLKVTEEASVAVTLLGGNTGWSSSMAYYYYKDGETPTSRDQIKPILIVPNTQDGMYSAGNKTQNNTANSAKGIDRGTNVQLYFYGFGDDMKEENKTSKFPAGTRIGFILKSHAWNDGNAWTICGNANASVNKTTAHFSTSTPGLNTKSSEYSEGSGVAMYTPDNQHVIFSFEDHIDDANFSDVVFTMTTNPASAFDEVTTLDDVENVTSIQKGVYAFEDLWPSAGDYDMNDVIVELSANKAIAKKNKVYTNTLSGASKTVSSEPYLKSESFIFSVDQNYATLANGLAFTFLPGEGINSSIVESAKLTVDGTEASFSVDGDVYYVMDDVKNFIGKNVVLTLSYKEPVYNEGKKAYEGAFVASTAQSSVQPFIYRAQGNTNWEVHIPYEAPTEKMDFTKFGTGDDKSDILKGTFYTRSGLYPFAFYLSGATKEDINELLLIENEKKAIDVLFPEFAAWSTSKGEVSKSWYKRKN